ncbi:hypothetical protein SUGI_0666490 [Cryptomeria japonica]|uniref:uncharacterized protein LOC131056764 n=1 Tax=Cryptomeria japonica TaxID=3369 RepID=UPI0024148BE8|nr:uncharacterized protein LOC131056764 [Cryptomeria japonica]GLJ33116.1 hypothetical protein SUGI_0666490 [Cryptomeria japonica]
MEGEINSWMIQNKEIAAELGMKIEAVETESINVRIGGSIIQMVIPSTSQDSFLAIFLDPEEGDETFTETLFDLNEKLERIRFSPDCMSKVLGCMVQVFEKHQRYKLSEGGENIESCVVSLAEDARLECDKALWACHDDPSILQGILPWCSVSLIPNLEAIELQMEVKGIMVEDHVTTGLGFCFELPLVIHLQFSSSAWSARVFSLDIFRSVQVYVMQSPIQSRQLRDSMEKMTVGLNERMRNAIAKSLQDRMRPYGPHVLVQLSVKEFFNNCKISTDGSLYVGEQISESHNIIVSLLVSLGNWMKNVKNWCAVCRKKLPPFSRLWYCDEVLCLFRFEELGIGTSVLQELKNSELIDLEITLAATAARCLDRDVFEPYPSFLLKNNEIRKRSGFFSSIESGKATASEPRDFLANKNLALIKQIIDAFPPLSEMQGCSNEIELVLKLGISWLQKDCKTGGINRDDLSEEEYADQLLLPYKILTYVLFTNRSSLYVLKNTNKLNVKGSLYEFAVFYNSESEEIFNQRRAAEGSVFAFHGSYICNWYSILRNGLKCLSETGYMSAGNFLGNGIYLSRHMEKAYTYCRSYRFSIHGESKVYRVMALCEVFSWEKYRKAHDVLVASNENDVVIRYLIVFNEEHDICIWETEKVIAGNMLSDETDFGEHYKRLRSQYVNEVMNIGSISVENRLELLQKKVSNK